jgi:hypothetical protein
MDFKVDPSEIERHPQVKESRTLRWSALTKPDGMRSAACARYLAAFEWRYNRPFELKENLGRRSRDQAAVAAFYHRDPTISSGSVRVIRFHFAQLRSSALATLPSPLSHGTTGQ